MDSETFGLIFGILILSSISGLIVKFSAREFAYLSNATFINSFIVVIISYILTVLIFLSIQSLIGIDNIVSLAIIIAISHIVIGKLIWKCKWIQSIKAVLLSVILFVFLYALGMKSTMS
jgi:hypothetical protein